ncbi:hypothetical protein [Achromobacter xylosoxidans]|uniref:hypothetical protein n=1 Tax=Alcaligenes xylosoxydans xylosoxydans TaxID=85698 RepID=UPI0006C4033B|nr:hypothetical protein [Achromobacter xylosoxidans]CUI41525.1 Uncharacterised protein [Achromobacter xylosoxidans]
MSALPAWDEVEPSRRWALKILAENERKGGKRYAITVLIMAKKALGLALNAGEVA